MKTKKSLGQHFLTSRTIVNRIVQVASVQKTDIVLEIGPGKGILTAALLEKAKKVIAVEKDTSLVKFLKEKFETEIKNKKLELVHGDILTLDLMSYKLKPKSYKLISNIPYYITGALFKKIFSSLTLPSTVTLLVQKEIAERVARSKKESILSLSIKAYGTPRYAKTVPARHFKPKPKVDSAILHIDNISKGFFSNIWTSDVQILEKQFFTLVRAGFAHKRKMLIKNIEHLYEKENLKEIFLKCNISSTTRAEDVPLEKWKCLCVGNKH